MAQPFDRTVSALELIDSVRRHKLLGTFVILAIMSVVVLAWLFLPREYGSEGRVVVRMGRANMGMNTGSDGNGIVSIQDTRETEIRSVMDMIRSEQVLGAIVDEVGSEEILSNTVQLPAWTSNLLAKVSSSGGASGEMSAEEYSVLRLREKAIQRLKKKLKIHHEKKSTNISIYCTAANPQLAQKVINELMTIAQNSHVTIHSAKRSVSHYDRGLTEKEAALRQRQQELEKFATENGFLTVDEARATLNGVINKLENEQIDAGLALRQSLAMATELRLQAKSVEVELLMPTIGVERSATSGARQQFYERVAEKARLAARYLPSHPKITEITSEIAKLRVEVDALPEDRTQSDKVRNPVYEQLMVSLITQTATAEAARERLTQVEAKMVEKEGQLKNYNKLKTRSSELERQVSLAQMEFDIYAKKRNEARLIDQLDKEAISDIVIQQPASLMLKKVSPKGSMMLPLGLFLATVCGIASCIFADRKNLTNLTTPEEIEEAIGVPVISTLPRVHSTRVLIN